ncbi:hypothetical protein HNQ50_000887 [Silvimonas terrae]|uniref:Uncharacterized protein n=1 Tax=Silvimonas terrae TaxID=300266 RepID=A0A840R9Y4_9NEIS|nr:hypothetical protein [Silvimonas terrae]MBB5190165.1 hypothetical protein [Silvimonas terrae]
MDTSTLRRQRAGGRAAGFMLDMLAAAAFVLAVNQAMNIADAADTTASAPGIEQAQITPAGLIVQPRATRAACKPIEESASPLLQGYGRYLLAEHAIAAGDVLSLPASCPQKQSALTVQPALQVNDEQELVQPEGLRLI